MANELRRPRAGKKRARWKAIAVASRALLYRPNFFLLLCQSLAALLSSFYRPAGLSQRQVSPNLGVLLTISPVWCHHQWRVVG